MIKKIVNLQISRSLKLIIINFGLAYVLFGCSENLNFSEELNLSNNAIESSEIEYTQKYLAVLGSNAVHISRNPVKRKDLYNKIEKKFDGDYNVLFEELIDNTKPNIRTRENNSLEVETKFKEALMAFKGLEGMDYYPQIYIPFYEELKESNSLNNSKKDPDIVLFLGDDSKITYPAYTLNENNELSKSGFYIDEGYARKNEVWVISINERYFGGDTINFETGITNGRTNSTPSAIVDQMKCKCNKESWAAGASEVHIITVASNFNITPSTVNLNLYSGGQYEGGEIYKFSRSQVSNQTNIDLDFKIWLNWNGVIPNSPYGHYVIFEYDAWPTGLRTAEWSQGGGFANVQYRSADTFYDKQSVLNSNFATHIVNNSCIEWKGQYQ